MTAYQFYMQTTGSDTNAGSTNSDSASVTSTNGNWNSTTRVFTAASGTPFSGVTAGTDWASIYVDGSSATPYIGQVSSVGGGGSSVTLDATLNTGSAPSTSATGRSCKIGGAWASFALCRSGNLFNTGASLSAFGIYVNVKKGTYANTTNSCFVNMSCTGIARVLFMGYVSTPGDPGEGDLGPPAASRTGDRNGGDLPSVTFTTGSFTLGGTQNHAHNLDFYTSGSSSTNVLNINGSHNVVHRCQIEHSQANSNAYAVQVQGTGCTLSSSYAKATSTATAVVNFGSTNPRCIGTYITGGASSVTSPVPSYLAHCILTGAASHGIVTSADNVIIDDCVIDSPGGDGIRVNTLGYVLVTNCLFVSCGGYDINNNTGGNNFQRIHLFNCASYSPTSGINNFTGGDWSELYHITEVSSPLTGGTDPPLVTGALSLAAGLPGYFEGTSIQAGMDIGFQNVPAGGGTSVPQFPRSTNGGLV